MVPSAFMLLDALPLATVKWIACLPPENRPFAAAYEAPRSPGGASDRYRLARGAAPKEGA